MESTLNGQFAVGQALYNSLETTNISSSEPKYQEDVRRAIAHFTTCAAMAAELSLFSANETVDDINTSDLRFILVEAYLGNLVTKLIGSERLEILQKAKQYHEQFLRNVELYEIIQTEDKKYMEDQNNDIKKDAARTREEKVARLKRRKCIEKELKELQENILGFKEEDNEDINRKHVIKLIELFIQKSIDELSSIKQEIELLQKMFKDREQKINSDTRNEGKDAVIEPRWKGENGPLLSKEGRPLRPFMITNQREAIQQQVFRPGWRLPTMTVDEYLQQEMERGNIIKGGGKVPEKKEIDDNDEAAIDAATYKARTWDDYKDTNPRGWGNRTGKG